MASSFGSPASALPLALSFSPHRHIPLRSHRPSSRPCRTLHCPLHQGLAGPFPTWREPGSQLPRAQPPSLNTACLFMLPGRNTDLFLTLGHLTFLSPQSLFLFSALREEPIKAFLQRPTMGPDPWSTLSMCSWCVSQKEAPAGSQPHPIKGHGAWHT